MAKGMKGMLKQAQKMQKQMTEMQDNLAKKEFEGEAGGGMVKIKMNGQGEILGLSIKPEAVDLDDMEMLEDLILAAIHTTKEKVSSETDSQFSGLPGGMKIPGLM